MRPKNTTSPQRTPRIRALLRLIVRRGGHGGLTRSNMLRGTHLKADELTRALALLLDRGDIEEVTDAPTTTYRATEGVQAPPRERQTRPPLAEPAVPQYLTRLPRFWDDVDLSAPEYCWPWLGRIVRGVPMCGNESARHVAWEACHGRLPVGMRFYPTCGTPGCVNPDHSHIRSLPLTKPIPTLPAPRRGRPPKRGRLIADLTPYERRRFLVYPELAE